MRLVGMWEMGVLAGSALAASGLSNRGIVRQDFGIDRNNYTYLFNMDIGTPPQMVSVCIDYASADLIFTSGSNPCQNSTCSAQGYYDAVDFEASSTIQMNNTYVSVPLSSDGSILAGLWALDNVTFGNDGRMLNKTMFLIRDTSTFSGLDVGYDSILDSPNLFGVGPRGLQTTISWVDAKGFPGPTYDNVLSRLSGSTPSFSIWVDPATKTKGTLVIGGIDESMYVADSLVAVPLAIPTGQYADLAAPIYIGVGYYYLTATVTDSSSRMLSDTWFVGESIAIFNSRARFSMPLSLLKQVGNLISAEWSASESMYIVKCNLKGTLSFYIGPSSINVTISEHLINLRAEDKSGAPLCGLNIGVSDQVMFSNRILKDYFIAVDYSNNMLYLGEQGRGPSPGTTQQQQEQSEVSLAGSISGVIIPTSMISDATGVIPEAEIYFSQTTSGVLSGPKFYQSQSTAYQLETEPLASAVINNGTTNVSLSSSYLRNGGVSSQHAAGSGLLIYLLFTLVLSFNV